MNRIVKIVVGLAVVAGLIFGGVKLFGYIGDAPKRDAESAGVKYVKMIVGGKLAEAYTSSSKSLRGRQTQTGFSASLAGLSATTPTYKPVQDIYIRSEKAYFFQQVDGLTPTRSGRTDGVFELIMVDESGWKVDSVVIH